MSTVTSRPAGLQAKMDEYVANGGRLGWLIDPIRKRIHVYRPDTAPESPFAIFAIHGLLF